MKKFASFITTSYKKSIHHIYALTLISILSDPKNVLEIDYLVFYKKRQEFGFNEIIQATDIHSDSRNRYYIHSSKNWFFDHKKVMILRPDFDQFWNGH